MRHGPVAIEDRHVAITEMGKWIDDYRSAPVAGSDFEPSLQELICGAAHVVCSNENRSRMSAELLSREPDHLSELFREADLPYPQKSWFGVLRLRGSRWAALLRLLWLLGYAENAESIHDARRRAVKGAALLATLATTGDVVLVGHGIMNRLLARQLAKGDWENENGPPGTSCRSSMPWGYQLFRQ